jgi:alpha-amylase
MAQAAGAPATRLVLALHFHQPHGNLDHVFEDATDRCYAPTVDLLAAHPHVRAAAHVSGPLLDWLERRRPALVDRLGGLVRRGQIEPLGGGYQEPMLAILPDRDAIGQLVRMRERTEQLLGARPSGMWLAERVWEPDLARVIARGGYRYTLLDDTHLLAAGAGEPLGSHYVTDKAGDTVAVFPIDRGLRMRIPFAEIDELVTYLLGARGRTLTYGDDAEKFGLWPTTHRRVWGERWLERLFDALGRHAGAVETVTPSQVLADTPSSGAIYLPTISYAEMGSWTLPPDQGLAFAALVRRLRFADMSEDAERFLRGGIWQAFLAKYPESGLLYRKMLRVSRAVEEARLRGDAGFAEARDALYRGQCNCAYWHGLFGGLYLQHLRAAVSTALLEAEALADPRPAGTARIETRDHDGDLRDEVIVETPELDVYVSPARGGSALEIDLRPARFHLTGVIGRRREAYHALVPQARYVPEEALESVSAHELVRATEPNLAEKLVYDRHPRGGFVDHLLAAEVTPEAFDREHYAVVDLARAEYALVAARAEGSRADIELAHESAGIHVRKRWSVAAATRAPASIALGWELAGTVPLAPRRVCFATELDFTLLSPDTVGGRALEVLGASGPLDAERAPGARGRHEGVCAVRIRCADLGVAVELGVRPPAELWRIPIETVSQSERGFERAYQGTALLFAWRFELGAAPFEPAVELVIG